MTKNNITKLWILFLLAGAMWVIPEVVAPDGDTSIFPRCVGGDITRLQDERMSLCLRFRNDFEAMGQENGVFESGMDLLSLIVTASHENGCKSYANDDSGASRGGIMQVDDPCLVHPEQCPTTREEINQGTRIYAMCAQNSISKGLRGQEAMWLAWFCYNRGIGTANRAIRAMQSGTPAAEATQEACEWLKDIRAERSGRPQGSHFCRLQPDLSDIGIHYSDVSWHMYLHYCEQIGGEVVFEGAPIETVSSTSIGNENSGDSSGVRTQTIQGYRPSHPYFEVPYSITPAINSQIEYDLEIYEKIPERIQGMNRCQNDIDCIINQIAEAETELPEYNWIASYGGNIITLNEENEEEIEEWKAYCEHPDKHALNSLTETIDSCMSTSQQECSCPYKIPMIQGHEGETDTNFVQNLFERGPFETLLGLVRRGYEEFQDFMGWTSVTLELEQSGNNIRIRVVDPENNAGSNLIEGEFDKIENELQGESPNQFLYNINDAGTIIDVYKTEEGKIQLKPQNDYEQCERHNKIVKFCVVQDDTILAYNEDENELGMQQLVLKFAYEFRGDVSDVQNIVVQDAKMQSNAALVAWDKVQGSEITRYKIYYTTNNALESVIRETTPQEFENDDLTIREFEINDENVITITNTDPTQDPRCIVEDYTCTPQFVVQTLTNPEGIGTDIYPDQLYYIQQLDSYFVILPDITDGTRYTFAITAVDDEDEESPSFNLPGTYSQAEMDVKPGLGEVQGLVLAGDHVVVRIHQIDYNIDGSDLNPDQVDNYKVYCFSPDFSGEVELSSKEALFGTEIERDGESVEFRLNKLDFNSLNCGGDGAYRIVVAGSRGVDGSFGGTVTEDALSVQSVNVEE